jgi:hypothetical protein
MKLKWRKWPVAEQGWWRAAFLFLFLTGIWLVLAYSLPLFVATALVLALVLALFPFFIPTEYIVLAEGLEIRRILFCRVYRWAQFAGCEKTIKGYWLLPLSGGKEQPLFLPTPLLKSEDISLKALLEEHFPILELNSKL